jgi:hypothetical protein
MEGLASLLFVPGGLLIFVGLIWTLVGARRSPAEAIRGIRMRYLGLALLFLLPGAGFAVSSLANGLDLGRLLISLVFLGFGALYLYARGGIGPRFPMA